jgi:hypothetical protein
MALEQQPPNPPASDETRKMAEKRVKERIALISHLGTYVVVNGFLVVVWALSGGGYPWFLWVIAGWGIGLVLNIFTYFTGSKGDTARERMIRKEMERLERKRD